MKHDICQLQLLFIFLDRESNPECLHGEFSGVYHVFKVTNVMD